MVNNNKQLIALAVVLVLVVGILVVMRLNRSGDDEKLYEQFFAMDTVMDITLYKTDKTDEKLSDIMTEMRDRIYQMEAELSVTKKDSDVSKLNAAKGAAVKVSEDTYYLLSSAIKVADETEGRFDPTIYPIVKLWGFTTGKNRVPSDDEIKNELKKVDYKQVYVSEDHNVSMRGDAQIDLGACAKGYLSDELCEIMQANNVNGIVSLGGNVQSVGTKPDGTDFTVGIADPKDPSSVYEKIVARNNAVVTSGNYERYFEQDGKRYHHIMDPKTGAPADNGLASVTVVGPNGLLCDAYATAFFVMGEERSKAVLEKNPFYKAAFIYEDGHDSGFDKLK